MSRCPWPTQNNPKERFPKARSFFDRFLHFFHFGRGSKCIFWKTRKVEKGLFVLWGGGWSRFRPAERKAYDIAMSSPAVQFRIVPPLIWFVLPIPIPYPPVLAYFHPHPHPFIFPGIAVCYSLLFPCHHPNVDVPIHIHFPHPQFVTLLKRGDPHAPLHLL